MVHGVSTVILVGRRADNGWRDLLWDVCRARWHDLTDWPVIEGHHDDGPFNLAAAYNTAARHAGDWDTCVYIGSDWVALTAEQLHDAVAVAQQTRKLVFAHNQTVLLDEEHTRLFIDTDGGLLDLDGADTHTNTFSGVVAVPRVVWDRVGGFDERFLNWGGEDIAFWCACCALTPGYERVPGTIVHLWHPRSRAMNEAHPCYPANDALMRRYLDARHSRTRTNAILREPGGPLGPRL